jgi:hypothetical protein
VDAGDYHTDEQLRALGERLRDRAIQISIEQESAQVVRRSHTEHTADPLIDPSGHVAADPPVTRR